MSFNYYENTNFINNRNRKRTLILDVEDGATGVSHLGSGGVFNIQLYEPLRIDKHSEIYLDNFLTFNSNITNSASATAFVLKINEFNMNSNVASTHNASGNNPGGQHLFNSLIIPNEHRDPSNNHSTVVHKGKKFNYVCDINPQTISSLSGTITDLAGQPIFHGTHNTTGQFTYALTGIAQSLTFDPDTLSPFQPTDVLTAITRGGAAPTGTGDSGPTGGVTGNIIISSGTDSTIHFALAEELTTTEFSNNAGALVFHLTRGTTPFTVTLANANTGANPDLQLIKGDGRFIAEFSILSRE
jgi:hypothetical protein